MYLFGHPWGGGRYRRVNFPPPYIFAPISPSSLLFQAISSSSLFCIPPPTPSSPTSLSNLEGFRNYKGLSFIFPKILDVISLTYFEKENFSDCSLRYIFKSENLRFPFFYEYSQTWGGKCEKLNFRKSLGIY